MVSGGGFVELESWAGQKAVYMGTKTLFGFNFKNGNALLIRKIQHTDTANRIGRDLHTYQADSGQISSLDSSKTAGTASFYGTAVITDVTFANDPMDPRTMTVDGDASFLVTLTDWGEPGIGHDSLAITLSDHDGGLWFASN